MVHSNILNSPFASSRSLNNIIRIYIIHIKKNLFVVQKDVEEEKVFFKKNN